METVRSSDGSTVGILHFRSRIPSRKVAMKSKECRRIGRRYTTESSRSVGFIALLIPIDSISLYNLGSHSLSHSPPLFFFSVQMFPNFPLFFTLPTPTPHASVARVRLIGYNLDQCTFFLIFVPNQLLLFFSLHFLDSPCMRVFHRCSVFLYIHIILYIWLCYHQ